MTKLGVTFTIRSEQRQHTDLLLHNINLYTARNNVLPNFKDRDFFENILQIKAGFLEGFCVKCHIQTIWRKAFILIYWTPKFTSHRNNPVDTGPKLNVHKTFRRRPERLLNVLCTFNSCPVLTGKSIDWFLYNDSFCV